MQPSTQVRDTLLRFYEVFSAQDLQSLAQIIAQQPAESVLAIGTAGEWLEGREQLIAALEAQMNEMEGFRLEAGEEPHCYEEGSIGWIADRPTFVLPEGTISTRLTGVVRQEEGE